MFSSTFRSSQQIFSNKQKPCSLPCPLTTFQYLFSPSDTLKAKRDLSQNYLLTVEDNISNFNGYLKADTTASVQKRLPMFTKKATNKVQQPECLQGHFAGQKSLEVNASKQTNQPIRTDQITTESLKRLQSIVTQFFKFFTQLLVGV